MTRWPRVFVTTAQTLPLRQSRAARWAGAGTAQGHPLYLDPNRRGSRVILSGLEPGVVGVDRDYLFCPTFRVLMLM